MDTRRKLVGMSCLVAGITGLSIFSVMNAPPKAGTPVLLDGASPSQRPPAAEARAVTFPADAYGQFWITGSANGVRFKFLADTGATEVVFSRRDAERLGIAVDKLNFNGKASTANGKVRTASAHVALLSVGPFSLVDVPVTIDDGELGAPLLGMTFLARMNVTIRDGILTLGS